MEQFIGGYLLDDLEKLFNHDVNKLNNFKSLTKWASYFQIISKSGFESNKVEKYSSEIAVLINILQRGTPTLISLFALEYLSSKSEKFKIENINGEIKITFNDFNTNISDLIFRSFHLIDPRLSVNNLQDEYNQSGKYFGSEFEEDFIFNVLPENLNENGKVLAQLLTDQRLLTSIIEEKKDINKLDSKIKNNFKEQRTDFSIEFPYYVEGKPKGIIIEIDGSQHQNSEQMYLDTERDKAVVDCGWSNTLRFKTSEFTNGSISNKINKILVPLLNNEYFENCLKNYKEPIWDQKNGDEILQICLIPIAIARIQKVILDLINQDKLDTTLKKWKIAIIERDVPCAELAINDLNSTINNYNSFSNNKIQLPKIELEVFANNKFLNSKYRENVCKKIEEYEFSKSYDLIIDISILLSNIHNSIIHNTSNEVVVIRSINYIGTKRRIATSDLITYKQLCKLDNTSGKWVIEDEEANIGLNYFIKSIFRKESFREGQLPIINNALQCKSVIGLLPTGGGKSLTYQLSALLQPGICIVIDPIRSLMKDQVDGLNRNYIDSCLFINSNVKGDNKRKAIIKMTNGESHFLFVSPERLQMDDFRNSLEELYNNELYFGYCVIDEAHCVSEWGHDFRTAYLRLGENAIKFCKTKNLSNLPLFGLTATASYDVLADVQRELSGNYENRRLTEENIVRSEFTKRPELQFIIEDVSFPEMGLNTIWDLKKELGHKKQERVINLINNISNDIRKYSLNPSLIFAEEDLTDNDFNAIGRFEKIRLENIRNTDFYNNTQSGIIFCPHTKGIFGVTDIFNVNKNNTINGRQGYYDVLSSINGINATFFMGGGNISSEFADSISENSTDNQDEFIANRSNLMVATKAFGMGIDKKNVRYTIHVNYPGSIESYVQEAGRSGRDGQMALSYILFNAQTPTIPSEEREVDNDFEINMFFHNNSFKGVEKELAVLDELLTEIYFPDRTFELENILNNEFNINIKCNYWEGGFNKRLYINYNYNEQLGYFDLSTLRGNPNGSINHDLSLNLFSFLNNYISGLNLEEPVHIWLQKSDKQIGIEEILKIKKNNEPFNITVGFYNNINERVKTITKWLHDVVDQNFNEQIVKKMRASCNDADAFIDQVCENYKRFNNGQELNFEKLCLNRDSSKGNPYGTAIIRFIEIYNGYRDKADTEKAIYRLSTLGVIDDYTVNFTSNTFNLTGRKKNESEYTNNLRKYLLKYYSEKTTEDMMLNLQTYNDDSSIKRDLEFLISFVYKNIKNKRQQSMRDMKTACLDALDKREEGSLWLKDYINLYFNSKYARSGYNYYQDGKIVNASLSDITNNGKDDNFEFVWFFINVMKEDMSGGSEIDNFKHLRGACTRMLSSISEPSFSIKLLNAFSLYMLEYRRERYLLEAETLIFDAFYILQEKQPNYSDNTLKNLYKLFVDKILENNPQLTKFMKEFGLEFDFDSILIGRILKPLTNINKNLSQLNNKLNYNG